MDTVSVTPVVSRDVGKGDVYHRWFYMMVYYVGKRDFPLANIIYSLRCFIDVCVKEKATQLLEDYINDEVKRKDYLHILRQGLAVG
jgi:hypothetical protein